MALYREKAEADDAFKTLIKTTFGLTSWPTANSAWWSLESPAFVSNFRRRFNTSEVEDLMGARAKHSAVVGQKVTEIVKLTQQIDRSFYKLFGLTRREIETVEAMEFTYL